MQPKALIRRKRRAKLMSKLFLSFVSNLALLCLPISGDFDGGSSMCVTAFQNWPSFAFRHRVNIPADSDSVGRHSRRIVRAVTRSSDLPPKSGPDSTTRRQLNTARPIKTAEKNNGVSSFSHDNLANPFPTGYPWHLPKLTMIE